MGVEIKQLRQAHRTQHHNENSAEETEGTHNDSETHDMRQWRHQFHELPHDDKSILTHDLPPF